MPAILDQVFTAITRKRKANDKAVADDAKSWAIEIGKDELGLPHRKIDNDHVAIVVDAATIDQAKFRQMVDTYKQRFTWAQLASNRKRLQQAARDYEQQVKEFDEAEAKRHREALDKLREMQNELARKMDAANIAERAHGDLLASAPMTDEERELTKRQSQLNERANELKEALGTRRPWWLYGSMAAMAEREPGVCEAEALRDLKQIADKAPNVDCSPERKAALGSLLAAARRHKRVKQDALDGINKELDAINGRLAAIAATKVLAETF